MFIFLSISNNICSCFKWKLRLSCGWLAPLCVYPSAFDVLFWAFLQAGGYQCYFTALALICVGIWKLCRCVAAVFAVLKFDIYLYAFVNKELQVVIFVVFFIGILPYGRSVLLLFLFLFVVVVLFYLIFVCMCIFEAL